MTNKGWVVLLNGLVRPAPRVAAPESGPRSESVVPAEAADAPLRSRAFLSRLGRPGRGLAAPAPSRAAEPVAVELIVAVDVSRSVDVEEGRLQRAGYVAAFSDEIVIEAIQSGFFGKIAVLYFEWGSVQWLAAFREIEDRKFPIACLGSVGIISRYDRSLIGKSRGLHEASRLLSRNVGLGYRGRGSVAPDDNHLRGRDPDSRKRGIRDDARI